MILLEAARHKAGQIPRDLRGDLAGFADGVEHAFDELRQPADAPRHDVHGKRLAADHAAGALHDKNVLQRPNVPGQLEQPLPALAFDGAAPFVEQQIRIVAAMGERRLHVVDFAQHGAEEVQGVNADIAEREPAVSQMGRQRPADVVRIGGAPQIAGGEHLADASRLDLSQRFGDKRVRQVGMIDADAPLHLRRTFGDLAAMIDARCQRFFDQHVAIHVERLHRQRVVRLGRRGDVDDVNAELAEGVRTVHRVGNAELAGRLLGPLGVQIAECDQLHVGARPDPGGMEGANMPRTDDCRSKCGSRVIHGFKVAELRHSAGTQAATASRGFARRWFSMRSMTASTRASQLDPATVAMRRSAAASGS